MNKSKSMGKFIKWIEAVIANNHRYAPMAGVDIKKSADRLFEKEVPDENETTNDSLKKNEMKE